MSFGEGDLHERVEQLESLVRDMYECLDRFCDASQCMECPIVGEGVPCRLGACGGRMEELGLTREHLWEMGGGAE